ncbi:MAG: hypothetical protein ABR532_02575 [Candidatus Dormibacteria bacterium]
MGRLVGLVVLLIGSVIGALALLFAVCAVFHIPDSTRTQCLSFALGLPGLIVTLSATQSAKVKASE